jgi:hypothetical protein
MTYDLKVRMLDPHLLDPHPENWRIHPERQRSAVAKSLAAYGWLEPVVWNERTGHILDGHARVTEAIRLEMPSIPVVVLDLAPEMEREILASGDWIGEMAGRDPERQLDLIRRQLEMTGEVPFAYEGDPLLQQLMPLADFTPIGLGTGGGGSEEKAPVRTETLLIAISDHEEVLRYLAALSEYYGADNPSDGVLETLRDARKNSG